MVNTTSVRTLGAVLALGALIAGCSSSTDGSGTIAPTVPTSSAQVSAPPSSPPSTQPAAPSSPPAAPETITPGQASVALLTPAEVGSGFSKAQFQPNDEPLPCLPDEPSLEEQVPSTLQVGTAVINSKFGAAMGEDLRLYPDDTAAHDLIAFAQRGLDCDHGQLRITGPAEDVTFGEEQDVASGVGADEAIAVPAKSARFNLVLVACRVGRAVLLFNFLQTQETQASALPNPLSIVAKGVAKLRNS